MNRDDIIRMAREAGMRVGANLGGVVLVGSPAEIGLAHLTIEELERFAALVAAAEREACAKIAEDDDHIVDGRTYYDQLGDANATARKITSAIRARGQQ